MGLGKRLWTVSYFKTDGTREYRITPYLPSKEQAFCWLIQQKPYLLEHPHEIDIRPWRWGDPR